MNFVYIKFVYIIISLLQVSHGDAHLLLGCCHPQARPFHIFGTDLAQLIQVSSIICFKVGSVSSSTLALMAPAVIDTVTQDHRCTK